MTQKEKMSARKEERVQAIRLHVRQIRHALRLSGDGEPKIVGEAYGLTLPRKASSK